MCLRHSCHDDDCNETSNYNQDKPALVEEGKKTIAEDDEGAARPGDYDKGDKDVPGFNCEVRVEDGVHLNDDVGGDGDDRSKVEDPAEEVQEAGEETHHAAVAGAGGHGRPVVDPAS